MLHFKAILLNQTIDEDERLRLLFELCKGLLASHGKGKIRLPEDLIRAVVSIVIDRNAIVSPVDLLKRYKEYAGATGWLLGEFRRLYRDFRKVEDAVKSDLRDIIEADYEILKIAHKSGVHVEAQLLQIIVHEALKLKDKDQKIRSRIDLGISKLCCLYCDALLEAANEVFKDSSLEIHFS